MKVEVSIYGEVADILEHMNNMHPEVRLIVALGPEKLETERVGRVISARVKNLKGLIVDLEIEVELDDAHRTEEE